MGHIIEDIFQSVLHRMYLPSDNNKIDYDKDADVLYVSFESLNMQMIVKWMIILLLIILENK